MRELGDGRSQAVKRAALDEAYRRPSDCFGIFVTRRCLRGKGSDDGLAPATLAQYVFALVGRIAYLAAAT